MGWKPVKQMLDASRLISFHKIVVTQFPESDYVKITENVTDRPTRQTSHGKLGTGKQDLDRTGNTN